jgi:hypothetical protein
MLQAQCESEEVLRADGVLVRNYAYQKVVENDTFRINMALSYIQGEYNLLLRYRYLDSLITNPRKPYGNVLLKLSDSTVVQATFITGNKDISAPRFVCQYNLNKKDLGYLEKNQVVYVTLIYKKGKHRQLFKVMYNADIINKQLDCVRGR